ncbi:MAG: hypothetical protein KGZ39_07695 [Simkania sp.]|nr:hypothetical protein [Simkania sp.]
MKWFKRCFFLLILFLLPTLHAGTVILINDSPYQLRAVVRGSDGSVKGEMVIDATNTSAWTDTFQGYSRPDRSQTPYTVLWYCLDGSPFSVFSGVATGGTATALGGSGARQCRGKNLQQQQQQLQQQQQQGSQPSPPMFPPGQQPPQPGCYCYPQQAAPQPSPPPPYPASQPEDQSPNYQTPGSQYKE